MKIRTRPIKGVVIFASVVLVVCVGLIIFFALSFTNENKVISILAFVFCGVFTLISSFVLLNQLFCYIEYKDKVLIKHTLWFSKSLKIEKITKIILEDGMYKIYRDEKKFYEMPSAIKGSNEIIIILENNGVSVK